MNKKIKKIIIIPGKKPGYIKILFLFYFEKIFVRNLNHDTTNVQTKKEEC